MVCLHGFTDICSGLTVRIWTHTTVRKGGDKNWKTSHLSSLRRKGWPILRVTVHNFPVSDGPPATLWSLPFVHEAAPSLLIIPVEKLYFYPGRMDPWLGKHQDCEEGVRGGWMKISIDFFPELKDLLQSGLRFWWNSLSISSGGEFFPFSSCFPEHLLW